MFGKYTITCQMEDLSARIIFCAWLITSKLSFRILLFINTISMFLLQYGQVFTINVTHPSFCREFRNLKPLRPSESSPTRLAVTKVRVEATVDDNVVWQPTSVAFASSFIINSAGCLTGSCLDPGQGWQGWLLETLQVRSYKRYFLLLPPILNCPAIVVFQLTFLGLCMRDLRALSAASDSHHLVSFKDNLFVCLTKWSNHQEKHVISSPGRNKNSWALNTTMLSCRRQSWGMM